MGGGGGGQGLSGVFVENLLFHIAEKLHRGTLLCFRKFLLSKNGNDKRGGGASPFCVEIVVFHSTETFPTRTFLCFRKIPVSKDFMDKRGAGRDYHDFPSKNCCLSAENFRRAPLVFQKFRVSTYVSEIVKLFGTTETRSRTYCFRTLLS